MIQSKLDPDAKKPPCKAVLSGLESDNFLDRVAIPFAEEQLRITPSV